MKTYRMWSSRIHALLMVLAALAFFHSIHLGIISVVLVVVSDLFFFVLLGNGSKIDKCKAGAIYLLAILAFVLTLTS